MPPMMPLESFQTCVLQAAQKYHVPACVLLAIHQIESRGSRQTGLVRSNQNGTKDYGVTQINDVWVRYFNRQFGITAALITHDVCLAVHASAYVIRYEINAAGDFWTGVGRYHSRMPTRHQWYRQQVALEAQRFGCQIK